MTGDEAQSARPASSAPPGEPRRSALRRIVTNRWLMLYLALLVASLATRWVRFHDLDERRADRRSAPPRLEVIVPKMRSDGPVEGSKLALGVVHTEPSEALRDESKLPVILLHGSPSSGGMDFASFAPALARAGYDCYAIDLPGFGASEWRTASYSIVSNARLALAVMDELGIDRAHLLGWSQGGGSCMYMADLAPERVASITMMGSIGAQETEGSGDYYFEHTKYFLGKIVFWVVPELIPHFGYLGPFSLRYAWIRNFDDSDQRRLSRLMPTLETPTLILHGRHDWLVPAWGAEAHHEMLPASSLVMFDASHFLPSRSSPAFDRVVAHTLAHLDRHDDPRAVPLRASTIYAPDSMRRVHSLGGIEISREIPWWLIILAIWAATLVSEDLTIISVGLLIVSGSLEWSVALIGCFSAIILGDMGLWAAGRFLGRRILRVPIIRNMVSEEGLERWGRVFDKHTGKAVLMSRCIPGTRLPTFIAAGVLSRKPITFALWVALAAFIWTPFLLILTMIIGPKLLGIFEGIFHGPWAIVAAIVVLYLAFRFLSYETTPQGRDRLKADLARLVRREFWPAWFFYLPLLPRFAWLAIRHHGPMTFTCANPGIPNGGGVVGESKQQILDALAHLGPVIVPSRLIEPGEPVQRAEQARRIIRDTPELGGYPIVCKPNTGYKGYGMHVADSEDELQPYFERMTAPVQLQRFSPGPHEIGVLWARVPEPERPVDEWKGEVFSATHKTFPRLKGDGKRTLERLIWDHPRYRMQAKVFLNRFTGELDRVLEAGESLSLGQAGNHTQGAMFTDGMHLITPQLAVRLDEIARGFREPETGRSFDFGRFDLRYRSTEELARGEGFEVIELNGTASESTSMYDPHRSIVWCYGLLFRHWARLFRIGAARRREGARPMSLFGLLRAYREARPQTPGQRSSD